MKHTKGTIALSQSDVLVIELMRGCIVLAGTIQPVCGVFLFTLLYNTFTVLSIQLM